jgi:hypothetical protein
MIEKAAKTAKELVAGMNVKEEADILLEEWLLLAEGALDQRQTEWLIARTNTFIGMA